MYNRAREFSRALLPSHISTEAPTGMRDAEFRAYASGWTAHPRVVPCPPPPPLSLFYFFKKKKTPSSPPPPPPSSPFWFFPLPRPPGLKRGGGGVGERGVGGQGT